MYNGKRTAISALIGAVFTAALGIVAMQHVSVGGNSAGNVLAHYALVVCVIGLPAALLSIAVKVHLRRVLDSISNRIQKTARASEEKLAKQISPLIVRSSSIEDELRTLRKSQLAMSEFLKRDGNVQIVLNKLVAAERRLTESIEAAALTHADATAEAGRTTLAGGAEQYDHLRQSMTKLEELALDSRAQVEKFHAETSSLADTVQHGVERLSNGVKNDLVSLRDRVESTKAETSGGVQKLLETVGTMDRREDALAHLARRIERNVDDLSSNAAEITSASIVAGQDLVETTKMIMSRLGTVEEGIKNLNLADQKRRDYPQTENAQIVQTIRAIERSFYSSEQSPTLETRSLVDLVSAIEQKQEKNIDTAAKSARLIKHELRQLRERIDAIETSVRSQDFLQNIVLNRQQTPSPSTVRNSAVPRSQSITQSKAIHCGSGQGEKVEDPSYETQTSGAVVNHQKSLSNIWRLVRKVRNDSELDEVGRRAILTDLYAPLSTKDIRQHFVEDSRQYDIGVSFRSSMSNMMRLKDRLRALGCVLSPGGNSKSADLEFGRRLGVPGPESLAFDVPASKISPTPGTIIKPVHGSNSRGVFFVTDEGRLRSVKSGSIYENLEDAKPEYKSIIREGKEVKWMVEEAVLDSDGTPARDFKVYMFYGEMAMSLEIARSANDDGRNLYASYDEYGHQIRTSPNHPQMEGRGVNWQAVEMAKVISLSSPTPFLRIDFLVGSNGAYLGEITPHPGNTYAGDLYEDVDVKLGRYFLEAEARLYVDLLNGRKFPEYFEVYDVFEK